MSAYYSNSETEDDQGEWIGHGEGPSLEHYDVLPEIPSAPKKKKKKKLKIKVKSPLRVLPDIVQGSGGSFTPRPPSTPNADAFMPRPPSTPSQGKRRRRKSPSDLTEADLDPGTQYDVLPEIHRQPAVQKLKVDDIIINRSNGELNMYKKLPTIATTVQDKIAQHQGILELCSTSSERIADFQEELDRFKREMIAISALTPGRDEEVVIGYAKFSKPSTPNVENKENRGRPYTRSADKRRGINETVINEANTTKRYTPTPPKMRRKSGENIRRESGYASVFSKIGEKGTFMQVTEEDKYAGVKIVEGGGIKFVGASEGGRSGDYSPLPRM